MDDDWQALAVTIVVLCAAMILSPWSGFIDNGYVVTPATDEDIRNAEPLETVEVSFWELPPRVMLVSVLLSITPVLVFPAEFFFFLKIFSYLGYRRIASINVLDSSVRMRIYTAIINNPGIYFGDLMRITDQKPATLQYHLGILRFVGKITALDIRGDIRYFENSGRYSVTEQKILRSLRNVRERAILECLLAEPVLTRKDLVHHLGVSGATVSWHTGRLSDDGLLDVKKEGKYVRYFLPAEVRDILEHYLIDSSTISDPPVTKE